MIFAESLRWASIPWGKASCAAGFRRAGFGGKFLFWKWHETWSRFAGVGFTLVDIVPHKGNLIDSSLNFYAFIKNQTQ